MNRPADATQAFDTKREQLLRAAAYCFNQRGYSGTSLKDVARRLGLTDAAIYYYIDGKPQLLYECYLRAVAIGQNAMQTALATTGTEFQQATIYVREHVSALCGQQGPFAIMSEIPALAAQHREEILQSSRDHSRAFEALLTKGIANGNIRACDVRMTGNAVMGAINWIPKWFRGDTGQAEQTISSFPQILLGGLRCDAS